MYGRVERTEWLTPEMVRVVLGGEGLAEFAALDFTDSYVNLAFPPDGVRYDETVDVSAVAGMPRDQRPVRRRYSVRAWDESQRELTIDFVVHGHEGIAGPWASAASHGDLLHLTGPAGAYRPDPDAAWHLMVGDESALPAIAASMAAVPADTDVCVRLVCDGPNHEVALETPGVADIAWLHRRGGPSDADLLVAAVRDLKFRPGPVHAFVHGEAGEVREVRRHLLIDRNAPKETLSASGYWRRHMTDEAWREVKADWNAHVELDVV